MYRRFVSSRTLDKYSFSLMIKNEGKGREQEIEVIDLVLFYIAYLQEIVPSPVCHKLPLSLVEIFFLRFMTPYNLLFLMQLSRPCKF